MWHLQIQKSSQERCTRLYCRWNWRVLPVYISQISHFICCWQLLTPTTYIILCLCVSYFILIIFTIKLLWLGIEIFTHLHISLVISLSQPILCIQDILCYYTPNGRSPSNPIQTTICHMLHISYSLYLTAYMLSQTSPPLSLTLHLQPLQLICSYCITPTAHMLSQHDLHLH